VSGAPHTVPGRRDAARPVSARTAVAGVIGDPVEHSLSPALHNAAFAALGLDWVYVAFPVRRGDAHAAIVGAVALGVRGLSVTMPHKQAAALAADRRTAEVERLGAANAIVIRDGVSIACTTDGEGLLADLRASVGFEATGRRCVVVGAGGAARAVVLALAEAGAASVVVLNRTAERGELAAALAGRAGRAGRVEDVDDADLVVNATPVGMRAAAAAGPGASAPAGTGPAAVAAGAHPATRMSAARAHPASRTSAAEAHPATRTSAAEVLDLAAIGGRLVAGQLAVDLVYAPSTTPFLDAASGHGATTRNGRGMLVHQAAVAFELWTGEPAPVDAMWSAIDGSAADANSAGGQARGGPET